MNYRLATLIDREVATTATTRVLDIKLSEIVTAFSIQFRGTNSNSTPTGHPALMVTKVELVDGSDVLGSISGMQGEVLNISEAGQPIYSARNFISANICIFAVELRFGRWLWDEQLALDPNRYKNLQLKITHNKGLGGGTPTVGALSVLAHVFDEKSVSPIGFLMNKQISSKVMSGTAHRYFDLPTDFPCRKLIIKALLTARQPWQEFNKVKLYTDEQKKVIINDLRTSDLLRTYANHVNPYFTESIRLANNTTAFTCYLTPTFDTKMVWAPILGLDSGYMGLASYGGTFTADCSATTEGDIIVTGKCPHGAFCIPLGKQDEIDDWFDARGVGSWTLDLTGGTGSTATCEVVTQQLRSY